MFIENNLNGISIINGIAIFLFSMMVFIGGIGKRGYHIEDNDGEFSEDGLPLGWERHERRELT